MKTLKDRWTAKTPTFWKKVQRVGLVAGALGAAIIAAPIALPAVLVTASGYLVAVGGVTAALSQLTVEDKKELED
jgi:ABC-type xylose transport system permease subunit